MRRASEIVSNASAASCVVDDYSEDAGALSVALTCSEGEQVDAPIVEQSAFGAFRGHHVGT